MHRVLLSYTAELGFDFENQLELDEAETPTRSRMRINAKPNELGGRFENGHKMPPELLLIFTKHAQKQTDKTQENSKD